MNNIPQALTLSDLNARISNAVSAAPGLHDVWVVAETSDVRIKGGHCYLELVEKDPSGRQLAKIQAVIWQSTYLRLAAKFMSETGQQLRSDMKIMVLASADFHKVFGMKLFISDINGAYTLGDVMQRRIEILRRLESEGIINNNRELPWNTVPQRIAIISAPGAAGYGDFMKHLYGNQHHLRFMTRLFPAVMQGERTPASVIQALEAIAAEAECWDCVVIIRGGGATTDLLSFDDYDLAANVALFPLPIITGIGHDRDRTVLAHVSKIDVKTPTDAAQVLITIGEQQLAHVHDLAIAIQRAVNDRLSGCKEQLSYIEGALPSAVMGALTRAKAHIDRAHVAISSCSDRHIKPQRVRLDSKATALVNGIDVAISRQRTRLQNMQQLLEVLSPEATLKRGYSITRIDGHAVTSADEISTGQIIETILSNGTIMSKTIIN